MIETKQRQYEELAARLLKTARGEIVVGLRFLDTALFRLKDHPGQTDSFAVDGEKICYNIAHVFRRAGEESDACPGNNRNAGSGNGTDYAAGGSGSFR